MTKNKKMSRKLKAFLKKHGRFPKKGELRRKKASHNPGKRRKRGYVFTKARRAALKKAQRASRRKRGGGHRGKRSHKPRRRSRASVSFG